MPAPWLNGIKLFNPHKTLWRRYYICPFYRMGNWGKERSDSQPMSKTEFTPDHLTPESMLFTVTLICTLVHYIFFRKRVHMGQPMHLQLNLSYKLVCPAVPKKESIVIGMFNVLEQMWISRWLQTHYFQRWLSQKGTDSCTGLRPSITMCSTDSQEPRNSKERY